MSGAEQLRIPYQELHDVLRSAVVKTGMAPARAALCARLFADSSRDGVYSHGLNRFPRFIDMIRSGVVDVHAQPERVTAHGPLERWDGRRGPGNLNAWQCMDRAVALAREHGIGCVGMANTNHWMRGGTYGWQAADAGATAICWTNTMPNLPPWGATDPRIGNNPLVIAVPRAHDHVVLDMAMSQFSVGALASYRARGEALPVAGGFDDLGRLTNDASAIEASGRLLPMGFWKGSGLSIVLDLLAALLSGGRATWQIPSSVEAETGLSQVFLAFDISALSDPDATTRVVEQAIAHMQTGSSDGARARYTGERTIETRRRNMAEGVPVEPSVWEVVKTL